MLSYGDPKFDSVVVRDFATHASIEWSVISVKNPRGNAKVVRMIGALK